MTDRDFENRLYALYGEPAAGWTDDGVTARVLSEIDSETRVRRTVLMAAAIVSVALSMALLVTFAGPLVASVADIAGAPPLALWAVMLAGAASLGWAAARLAADA